MTKSDPIYHGILTCSLASQRDGHHDLAAILAWVAEAARLDGGHAMRLCLEKFKYPRSGEMARVVEAEKARRN